MRRCLQLSVLFLAGSASGFGFGDPPVAKIISNEPIEIDGITAPARNYVPIGIGGEVTTHASTAVIQFADGTTVSLQPNSQMRIEGKAGSPQINLLRGSAQYKLAAGSPTRVAGVKKESLTDKLRDDMMTRQPAGTLGVAPSDAVVYRGSTNRASATVMPGSPISVGNFSVGSVTQGTFVSAATTAGSSSGPSIITPGGLTINLTKNVNPTTNAVTYTVASISQTVTAPNGVSSVVEVTSSSLIGATITGVNSSTAVGSSVMVQIVPAGSTTPLTPTQATQMVQTDITKTVQTAIQAGQLPAGTTPPAPTPVSTGTFSPSAP